MTRVERVRDVAVIGGGVLGNFIAYDLAREGFDVVLLEKGYPAAGTSGATHAWIYVSTKTPGHYGRFSYASSLRYEALAEEHGVDFQYERSGGLSILWSEEALAEARHTVAEQNAAGIACEILTPREVAEREPIVSPDAIHGAIWSPLDGCVNPFHVVYAMNALAREAGATFRPYCEVTHAARAAHGFTLRTSEGTIRAERIVVAAGVWSLRIAEMLGFRLPIRPSRGQVLVSEPMPPTVRHILANGSVRQLIERGIILMGRVMEDDRTENDTTYEGLQAALKDVLALAPGLADVRVVRSYAGIRPKPFDGLPLLGEVPAHPGIFTAVTHSGVTLGPIIGQSLAELMSGRETTHDLTPYSWSRVGAAA